MDELGTFIFGFLKAISELHRGQSGLQPCTRMPTCDSLRRGQSQISQIFCSYLGAGQIVKYAM
jgi:hypothetical protein